MKRQFKYISIPLFLIFVIFFSCQKELYFDDPAISLSGKAVFTFPGSPDTCMNALISGNYTKNVILTSSNKINIEINVSTIGSYIISTNAINGYSFSATGLFTSTGKQTLSLSGTGIPIVEGKNIFTILGGTTKCTFSVSVIAPATGVTGNYFPMTKNSYWTYDDLFNQGDTVTRIVNDSVFTNGSLYKVFEEKKRAQSSEQYFFRRDDSVYYEYGSVDKYTVSFKFLPQIKRDILFLKEKLFTGATWKSDEFIGTASFGQELFLQYNFFCEDANATIIINGKTFTNVYKISMFPQIRSAITYPYNSTGEKRVFYFAKDIGLIYTKATNQSFTLLEMNLKNSLVN